MNTVQLEQDLQTVLQQQQNQHTNKIFLGVFGSNQIPTNLDISQTFAFIQNVQPSSLPGLHWVAYYHGYLDNTVDYFDPLGQPPEKSVSVQRLLLLANHQQTKIRFTRLRLQSYGTSVCGIYVALFLLDRINGNSYEDFLWKFNLVAPSSTTNSMIKKDDQLATLSNDFKALNLYTELIPTTMTANMYKSHLNSIISRYNNIL